MRGFVWMLIVAVIAAAAFYVLREHWGHALGFAPYLLFLACPLLHFFMLGQHNAKAGHGGSHTERDGR